MWGSEHTYLLHQRREYCRDHKHGELDILHTRQGAVGVEEGEVVGEQVVKEVLTLG